MLRIHSKSDRDQSKLSVCSSQQFHRGGRGYGVKITDRDSQLDDQPKVF